MKKWSREELLSLSSLLQEGLTIREALALSLGEKTKSYQSCTAALAHGESLENSIVPYLDKKIRNYLIPLQQLCGFKQALLLSVQFYEQCRKQKESWWRKMAYPFFLLTTSLLGLALFEKMGMNSLLVLAHNDAHGADFIMGVKTFIHVLYSFVCLLSLLVMIVLIYLRRRDRFVWTYERICRWWPHNPFCLLVGQEFIRLWLITRQAGLGSKDGFRVLRLLKQHPLISFLAYQLADYLSEGGEFIQMGELPYIDRYLCHFLRVASVQKNIHQGSERYLRVAQQKTEHWFRYGSITLQCSIYIFIAMIILLIYRVLMVPMQSLSSF